MSKPAVTSAIIVIGNEILSGRTQDTNINFIARNLAEIGVRLKEVRIIPDVEKTIISTVNSLRKKFDYIFTTGGIGPTHDDITSAAIAKAFSVSLVKNKRAVAALKKHYGEEHLNTARLKMAYIPEGAELIDNPVSSAPGFIMENVYVMAGVPMIMQAMFSGLKPALKGGAIVKSLTITTDIGESRIAEGLGFIQNKNPETEIGSYPFIKNGKIGTSLVIRGTRTTAIKKAGEQIKKLLAGSGGRVIPSSSGLAKPRTEDPAKP